MTTDGYVSLFNLKRGSGCETVMSDLAPVHVWLGDRILKLKHDDNETRTFPHIVLQKISKIRLQNKLLELSQCFYRNEKSNLRITDATQQRLAEVAKNIGQLDTVGLYYAFLQMIISIERFLTPTLNGQ